jgi:hypothetical protein
MNMKPAGHRDTTAVTLPVAMSAEADPRRRGQRTAAERAAAEAERKQREEASRLARRAEMPALLFGLMVRCRELMNAGCDVMFDLYAEVPKEHVSAKEYGLPGVVFRFKSEYARNMGGDWRDYVEYDVLTVEAEEWKVTALMQKFEALQTEADEKKRVRALAEEAKKLLTPEQLAALKQYG